jgi:sarcosine oxidase subunit beta
MQTFDVVVIGGGFLGLASAYALSRIGVRTLLLEAGDLGGGSSAACSGRAQVCEGHLDSLNLTLIREGLKQHATLEEELGAHYDWQRIGLFLLIRDEALWRLWIERAGILSHEEIPTELLDTRSLQSAEPHLNTEGLIGAAYSQEGFLDPLRFTQAYAHAARRVGADLRGHSAVVGMEVQGQRVTMVRTAQESFSAGQVAVMAGAWEAVVARMAGVEVPIRHTHAEALVTEPVPRIISHNIELADFYEIIRGKRKAVAIGIHPEPNGTLEITEAVTRTDELHQRVSAWGIASLAKNLLELFPSIGKVRVRRCWGRPTSFTPDEEPLIGWMPPLENLFLATSLEETLTTVPVLSEWMAKMIVGQTLPLSLEAYSPGRFSGGWVWH